MVDQFELSHHFIGESCDEALETVGCTVPVNTAQPGFASLLTALQGYREGTVGRDALEIYASTLRGHLAAGRSKLAAVVVPPGLHGRAGQPLAAMGAAMDGFQTVIDHVQEYLDTEEPQHLDVAEERLSSIHEQLPGFMSMLHDFAPAQTAVSGQSGQGPGVSSATMVSGFTTAN